MSNTPRTDAPTESMLISVRGVLRRSVMAS